MDDISDFSLINNEYEYKSPAIASFQWAMSINLMNDEKQLLYKRMVHLGYKNLSLDNVVTQYFNILKRNIRPTPRRIEKSSEFQCPEKYEIALAEFEDKVRKGESLTPFLSEKIKNPGYDDLLLNDWGIYHFHLSRRYRDDGFVQRSQYQIFAYITDECMYMIQVFAHDTPFLYCKEELVRILIENWSELVEMFHVKGAIELCERITDRDREVLRKAHATSLVEVGKGKVYGMLGGGYASNGYSCEALRNADFLYQRIKVFQKCLLDNVNAIRSLLKRYPSGEACFEGERMVIHISLCWIDNENSFTVCERLSGLIIQVNLVDSYFRMCKPYEVFGFDEY